MAAIEPLMVKPKAKYLKEYPVYPRSGSTQDGKILILAELWDDDGHPWRVGEVQVDLKLKASLGIGIVFGLQVMQMLRLNSIAQLLMKEAEECIRNNDLEISELSANETLGKLYIDTLGYQSLGILSQDEEAPCTKDLGGLEKLGVDLVHQKGMCLFQKQLV